MVIVVIWQLKLRNTKSTELTPRGSITPDYDTISIANDKNKDINRSSISVMPNDAYGSHLAMNSNEPQQQNTLTNPTDAYYVVQNI